jgi:Icc-related predicted phosphoesterase
MPQLESAANLRRRYSDVELIISCGDMPAAYLDFISSVLAKPLLYVRGNHDEMYAESPPGGIDLHNNYFEHKGISFIGLEGSIKYNQGDIQYTQSEMHVKVLQLAPRLRYNRWRKGFGVDVFVAHSPAKGIHDAEDFPHNGFDSFLNFMSWYRPRYMLHGHVHTWDRRKVVDSTYKSTRILNINPFMLLEIEPIIE